MPNHPAQTEATAILQTATNGIPSTKPVSLWTKFKQVCTAGACVDSFGAETFDEDARALDEDAANAASFSFSSTSIMEGGSVEGKVVGE